MAGSDKLWTIALELIVLPHSGLIAIRRGTASASGFMFGFFLLLIVTQMHGLDLDLWHKATLVAVFATSVGLVYGLHAECQHASPLRPEWNGTLHYPERVAYVESMPDEEKCMGFTTGESAFVRTIWRIPSGFYNLIAVFALIWLLASPPLLRLGARRPRLQCVLTVSVCVFCVALGFAPYFALFGLRVCADSDPACT